MIFTIKIFSTILYVHEMFGSRELITNFRAAPKNSGKPLV